MITWCIGHQGSISPVCAVQFHQQNYAQLHHYAQLENTLNFYAVRTTSCVSKIGVNLLAPKLRVKCWWNWPHYSMKTKEIYFDVLVFYSFNIILLSYATVVFQSKMLLLRMYVFAVMFVSLVIIFHRFLEGWVGRGVWQNILFA